MDKSYKLLKPDPGDIAATLLSRMLTIQLAEASNHNVSVDFTADVLTDTFVCSTWAVAVNVLWFLSLAFSLTAALVVTLVQQWIRDYLQRVHRHSQPQRRGRARRFLFAGIEKWKLEIVVEYIPTLLHLSLFLFFSGLCVFLSHVNQVVAWLVLCVFIGGLAAYAFVTIAPLLDPSAPYETPLSSAVQQIQRFLPFYNLSIGRDSFVQLKMRREQEATSSTSIGDRHALHWAYERITDDDELELFVESIPGFLASTNGQKVWWTTFGPSYNLTVEISIAQFLTTILRSEHMDYESKRKRAGVCLDALFSIFCSEGNLTRKLEWTSAIDEQSYNKFHLSLTSSLRELGGVDWDSDRSLIIKANSVLALSHRPPSIAKEFTAVSVAVRYEVSLAADKALADTTQMRCKLEDAIQSIQFEKMESRGAHISTEKVRTTLRDYITTLNESSHIVTEWMTIMGGTIQKNHWLSLLEWYTQLPLPSPSQTILLLPDNVLTELPHGTQLDIYTAWVLAAMRRVYLYPALPNFSDESSSTGHLDGSDMSGDGQSRPLKRSTLLDHLLRELQPMQMALCMLSNNSGISLARCITTRAVQLAGDRDKYYLSLPGPKHHKPGFFIPMGRQYPDRLTPEIYAAVIQRPFSMFTSIISDGLEGSRTLSVMALFSILKHSAITFKPQQSVVIRKSLQLLYPTGVGGQDFDNAALTSNVTTTPTSCVVKEATIFFYSVFSDILAWERELTSQDTICPLSSELQRLIKDILYVTLIQGRLTDMQIAEEMLRGTGSRLPDRHIRDMWDVRLCAAAICKRIRIQRSSIVQKKSANTLSTIGIGG
ncbi:hypothetical protein H0H87_004294 [Tephrocybe sp. NHM501043]|nr:hypothetical protein H0H87_004294 [Tephrocybe sp. NHM501043]